MMPRLQLPVAGQPGTHPNFTSNFTSNFTQNAKSMLSTNHHAIDR